MTHQACRRSLWRTLDLAVVCSLWWCLLLLRNVNHIEAALVVTCDGTSLHRCVHRTLHASFGLSMMRFPNSEEAESKKDRRESMAVMNISLANSWSFTEGAMAETTAEIESLVWGTSHPHADSNQALAERIWNWEQDRRSTFRFFF
jgi:hypothetical protein